MDNGKLQEKRKKEIPTLIEKYQKLVDDTFDAVSKPLPTFSDITDKDGDIIKTAEQQLYSFLGVRDAALDRADGILGKINELERELHDPTFWDVVENEDEVKSSPANKNPLKRHTKK
ncbi:hypothetical protein [Myroides odoratus]|uniref:Uncharacterized protein n=1 Tax=Myroides odoratus TaxID=256 RepID=A0A9Q7E731_MYROD|nr:hypothetical protein [Myroides odoratus]EHQ41546.1 hypothetical protein Myrod_0710 [Myroides odoratus DSM 2801]EKB02757.1 hypothetical protein HMPREF9716_03690 [Myroides odoratus CIP 103059]QQT98965.1 hypothetical protein I6I88_12160 [Myroides odoratus]WQD58847.1 hypothetical protein U0010_06815 [Myroides odoratus]STZ28809.1 Uncharacterised protein [Myroides odoratus]